jgi:hypothetical protein
MRCAGERFREIGGTARRPREQRGFCASAIADDLLARRQRQGFRLRQNQVQQTKQKPKRKRL